MSNKINNEVMEIKHMAFAVEDIEQSLIYYKDFLGVSKEIEIQDMPKSKTRVAVFNIGEIEYQLCQSMDPDGRFNKWINERGRGGLHHICYVVKNLDDLPIIKKLSEIDKRMRHIEDILANLTPNQLEKLSIDVKVLKDKDD